MSEEQDKLSVNLEAPKLFGRKKKSRTASPREPEVDSTLDRATDDAETTSHHTSADPPVPREESAEAKTAAGPAPDGGPEVEPTHTAAAPDHTETSVLPTTDPGEAEEHQQPVPAQSSARRGRSAVERLLVLGSRAGGRRDDDPERGADTTHRVPLLDHYRAAALTGAVIGVGMVLLTWLSRLGCEALRGTASCGTGPGFLLLAALFILATILGSAILKNFHVPDPGSSSFLAVALLAVVALLFLIGALDHWSMLLVVPLIAAGTYLLSVYVTKTVGEQDG